MQNFKGQHSTKDRSRPPKLEPLTTIGSMDLATNTSTTNSHPTLLTKPHIKNPSSTKGPSKIAGPYYISYGSPNQMKNLSFPTEDDLSREQLGIDSNAISKINTNAHSSLSSSPYNMSPRVSLPTLGHSQFAKSPLRTEDPSTAVSLFHGSQSWGNMNDSDFVKQSAYISQSPHFAKFSHSSHLLGRIEAKKSSLAKELFYYPEQIEVNKKFLQSQIDANMDKEDEDAGITTVIENKRFEVNLLEGRRAYFRLYCYKKFIPVKFQIDVFNGAFEVCLSKTKRRPGTAGYDYLYSIRDFEVNYENRSDLKYLYFKVKALERLQIKIMVSFKGAPPKLELPAISRSMKKLEKSHKKKSIYEFFSKDMGQQEFFHLKEIAEAIKAERKEKLLKITKNSRDIISENKNTVARYDELKLLEFIKSRQKDEMRIQQAKQNQLMLQEDRQKKQICEFFRDDLKKMKNAYEADANDKKRKLMYFQLNFFLTTAVLNLCKAIKERKTALEIVKLIQERLNRRAMVIQKGIRVMIGRPLHVQENKFGEKVFSDAQSRDALRIVQALNGWANMMKPTKTEKAEGVIFSFIEDLLVPFRASKGVNKYTKKVTKVQKEWKKQMTVNKSRLDTFVKQWEEYCMVLMKEEKSKSKKPNTDMIHRISDDKVKAYGKKFIRDKIRLLIKTSRVFLSLGKKADPEPEAASNFITEVPETVLKKEPEAPFNNMGARPRLKLKPTMEEFKIIFDGMVAEVEAERQSTRR